ncbi:MAG: hypothetical protein AAB420_02050 [Patescibacteria group bacterium]
MDTQTTPPEQPQVPVATGSPKLLIGIIVGVLVLGGFGAGAYYFYQKKQEVNSTTIPSASPTASATECETKYPGLDLIQKSAPLFFGGKLRICIPGNFYTGIVETEYSLLSAIASFPVMGEGVDDAIVGRRLDHPEVGDTTIIIQCGVFYSMKTGINVETISDEWLYSTTVLYGKPVYTVMDKVPGEGFNAEFLTNDSINMRTRIWEYNKTKPEQCEIRVLTNKPSEPNIENKIDAFFDSILFVPENAASATPASI